MNVISRCSIWLLTAFLTAGCGLIRDRSGDYQDAEQGKRVVVPDGYEQTRLQSQYPIPVITKAKELDRDFQMPRPPELAVASTETFFELETLADQDWLLVNLAPGRIWPSLDKFWESHGIFLEHENPGLGLMQTVRLGLSAKSRAFAQSLGLDVDARHYVVQSKLGQGVKRHTSELQVRVLDLSEAGDNDAFLPWSTTSSVRALESELLNRIGLYAESLRDQPGYSLLANDIGGSSRVSLVSEKGQSAYIKLDLAYERAWNSVEKSIGKAGYQILDRDRSAGAYYVYLPVDAPSLLQRLFSNEDDTPEANVLVRVKSSTAGAVRVTVENYGKAIDDEQLRLLLNQLLEHIS